VFIPLGPFVNEITEEASAPRVTSSLSVSVPVLLETAP
jgi:hypothetical protein